MSEVVLREVGGVRVIGAGADKWLSASGRTVCGRRVEFDSDTYDPDVDRDGVLQLPAHRGQKDYEIRLLSDGSILVTKEKKRFHCAVVEGLMSVRKLDKDEESPT